MTAAPVSQTDFSSSSPCVDALQGQHSCGTGGTSSGTVSGKLSVVKSTARRSQRAEVLSYRQHFKARFMRFLHKEFEGPAHVAHVFKCDPSTAENWWDGLNMPQGWVVGRAVADPEFRDAAVRFFSEAA